MALGIIELERLERDVMEELEDKMLRILTKANAMGNLEELLHVLGLDHLIHTENIELETYKNGKIVVIAGSEVKERDFLAIAKSLGIDKSRFEFCLDYDAAKKFNYKKLQYAPNYRVILFGAVPHSTTGKGLSGSVVAELEKRDEYPRVERLLNGNELKATKSNFRDKLKQLIAEDYI